MEIEYFQPNQTLRRIRNIADIKRHHLTVTEKACRFYFNIDVVERFKMLTYPPAFAITTDETTGETEWAIVLGENSPYTFPLSEHQGIHYFSNSELAHLIIQKFGKKRIYFQFEPTPLPNVFLLKEDFRNSEAKMRYNKKRELLEKKKTTSYYDTLIQTFNDPKFKS